jgi:hypothetical protein
MSWRMNLYRSALVVILQLASVLEMVGGCQRPTDSTRHADSLLVAPSAVSSKYLAYPDGREQLTYLVEHKAHQPAGQAQQVSTTSDTRKNL